MRKFKFYFLGFIPGLLLVIFILNKKGASCSYFPNDRVRAETLTKNFVFEPNFAQELAAQNLDEKFIREQVLEKGTIDFDRSKAQQVPCPQYILLFPADKPKYEIEFEKCKDEAVFKSLKTL